jgi:prepilin-type N-terminal cleavage/methylation domain-containing protein/prepilin-type processing-associated H-X9-DG protein
MFRSRRRPAGFTLIEMLVAVAIVVLLVGLLLPAIQKLRDSAARARCANNLRRIGAGLYAHHDAKAHFPHGVRSYQSSAIPDSSWTWMAYLLPYVDQEHLWKQAQTFARGGGTSWYPWHNPALGQGQQIYTCPNDPRGVLVVNDPEVWKTPVGLTMYLGNSGTTRTALDGVLYVDSKVRVDQITDGLGSTILVGERPPSTDLLYGWWFAAYGWDGYGNGDCVLTSADAALAEHFGCPPPTVAKTGLVPGNVSNQCDSAHWWSVHPHGAHFLMADGSCRFAGYGSNGAVRALSTRAGNDAVGGD